MIIKKLKNCKWDLKTETKEDEDFLIYLKKLNNSIDNLYKMFRDKK